jgi:hypothetical protein
MQVTLHRDDLLTLLKLIDSVNPVDDKLLGAGYVTLHVDSSSGIGSIVIAELPVNMNGVRGLFRHTIIDESSW